MVAVEPGDVSGKLAVRYRSRDPRGTHVARINRIGRGSELLSWHHIGERDRAGAGSHGDVQPAIRAVEHARAEIERDREQAIDHNRGGVSDGRAHLIAAARGVKERKTQIVCAVSGLSVAVETPLVREGGADALGQQS